LGEYGAVEPLKPYINSNLVLGENLFSILAEYLGVKSLKPYINSDLALAERHLGADTVEEFFGDMVEEG